MIAYLSGVLSKIKVQSIIIEVNSIGYEIYVPRSMLEDCPSIGEEMVVHTYLYVREDIMMLYGFMTEEDLEVFKKLITVNGIGPKGALALLSTISVDELKLAIITENDEIIARTPGIGKKTAQRLIIDLKDKLDLTLFDTKINIEQLNGLSSDSGSPRQEAIEALVSLGYSSHTAVQVVKKVTEYKDVEDIIKQALKQLALI
jgi:Holliday junction DNA helicase RuvA